MPAAAPLPAALVRRRADPSWVGGAFIVRDANGQALAYAYCEDEPGRRAAALFDLFAQDDASMRIDVMYLVTYRTGHRLVDVMILHKIFGREALNALSG